MYVCTMNVNPVKPLEGAVHLDHKVLSLEHNFQCQPQEPTRKMPSILTSSCASEYNLNVNIPRISTKSSFLINC
jgi:hypothetical protein